MTAYGNSLVGTSGVNGDSYFISPDNTTLLLADGASGAGKEGKVIMSGLCAETVKTYPFSLSGLSAEEYLDKTVWDINNKLISVSQKNGRYIFGTLVICVIKNDIATVVSVGDSPAFYIHGNFITRVAKTKKTYHNLVDLGFYSEEQLEEAVHKLPEHMWSMFDRFIPSVVPEYSIEEIALHSGDMIVLCCDGVSDYVEPPQIKDMLNADSLSESVDAIINSAKEHALNERNYFDDLTMAVYCH